MSAKLEIYLLGKPRGDSNSQPRGIPRLYAVELLGDELTNQKFLKNERNWEEKMDSHHRPPRGFPWCSATELLSSENKK